jgi:hypothetical protein
VNGAGNAQRPLSLAALLESATAAGWKAKPSWFVVSEHDNTIPPDWQRLIAGRHFAFVAQPVAVAEFRR